LLNTDPTPPWMAATSPTILLILLFYCSIMCINCPILKIVAKYGSKRMTSAVLVLFFY
jgi:hypothetical protein